MKPFSSQLTQSTTKLTLSIIVAPLVLLTAGWWIAIQGDPTDRFEAYKKALSVSDWETTLEMSDENTQVYLKNLAGWISDNTVELNHLDAFEQYLVLTSRFELRGKSVATIEPSELLGVWMTALDMRPELIRSKMMNQYYFGDVAVAQLFNSKTHSNTGKKIRFSYESEWKVDAMGLMEAFYEASAYGISDRAIRENFTGYTDKGYLSRHPKSLDPRMPERHTL